MSRWSSAWVVVTPRIHQDDLAGVEDAGMMRVSPEHEICIVGTAPHLQSGLASILAMCHRHRQTGHGHDSFHRYRLAHCRGITISTDGIQPRSSTPEGIEDVYGREITEMEDAICFLDCHLGTATEAGPLPSMGIGEDDDHGVTP